MEMYDKAINIRSDGQRNVSALNLLFIISKNSLKNTLKSRIENFGMCSGKQLAGLYYWPKKTL